MLSITSPTQLEPTVKELLYHGTDALVHSLVSLPLGKDSILIFLTVFLARRKTLSHFLDQSNLIFSEICL